MVLVLAGLCLEYTYLLIQRCWDIKYDTHLYIVDYDHCQHENIINILKETGIDRKKSIFYHQSYWNQKAGIKQGNHVSNVVEIKQGVRLGCILSPLLFNLFLENIFRKVLEHSSEGINLRAS